MKLVTGASNGMLQKTKFEKLITALCQGLALVLEVPSLKPEVLDQLVEEQFPFSTDSKGTFVTVHQLADLKGHPLVEPYLNQVG